MSDPVVEQLITQYAEAYGLDPRAVRSVALTEGGLGYGAVGDNGTSFGPFQLHVGGALPADKNAAWANSPPGLEYAIRKMSESGAKGLKGAAAIDSIVRKFERPADPENSIRKALGYYGDGAGSLPAGGSGSYSGSSGTSSAGAGMGAGAGGTQQALLQLLLSRQQQQAAGGPADLLRILEA